MLILVLVSLVGATLIVVYGTIFAHMRRLWPALLACAQCSGMWIGVVAGATGYAQTGRGVFLDALTFGAANSFLATLADALLTRLLGDLNEGP